jgi:prephenate dehydratase
LLVNSNFKIYQKNSEVRLERTTALLLTLFKDRVGLLHDMLACFSNQKINLAKIESKPSTKKLGEYTFFVEVEGHEKDENVKKALTTCKNLQD